MKNINLRKKIRNLILEQFQEYKNFSNLTDQDLYDIAKWGLMNDFSSSGAWDCSNGTDENVDSAIKCVISDFKNSLNDNYPEGLKNFPVNSILYRFVVLDNEHQLNKNNLGISWFANKNRINNSDFSAQLMHFRHRDGKNLYLIQASININKIDIPRTIWQRSLSNIENEVVLKDDTNLKLLKVEKIG